MVIKIRIRGVYPNLVVSLTISTVSSFQPSNSIGSWSCYYFCWSSHIDDFGSVVFFSFYLIVFWLTAVDLVILITIGIPSPTQSFIPGLKPSSSASPSHRSLSFSFFMTDYMDSPDCLLLLLSIDVFCFLVFFCFTLFNCRFRAVD